MGRIAVCCVATTVPEPPAVAAVNVVVAPTPGVTEPSEAGVTVQVAPVAGAAFPNTSTPLAENGRVVRAGTVAAPGLTVRETGAPATTVTACVPDA